jgi:iron complex outermembrane receptor protein
MTELEAPNLPIPAYSYFDVEAHYRINSHITLGFGVNNIANKIPPFIGTLDLRTDAATYDVIGRTMHASLKAKF